ncbi:MAG TPA: hypothetical protein VKB09_05280 [Thermomicrobiales bacterium]|nr:hypothetical protein [Thermomicrobiales bacterium]
MILRRVKRFNVPALVLAVLTVVGMSVGGAAAVTQPGYDTMRIDEGGSAMPYQVWTDWAPYILPMPDGGAWVFFSAQTKVPNPQNPSETVLGTRKLYASHFDPVSGTWQPATAFSGGQIQFGPTAVVDNQGTVHLIYTDRQDAQAGSFGTLVYRKSTADGGWTDPVPVATDPAAGHQLSPELVLDGQGGLHVAWQDQRLVTEDRRSGQTAQASNADVFASDLLPDGSWSAPVPINVRPDETTNASRPQLVVDGDRLMAVWSIYDEATGLNSAARVEWSTRPLADASQWAPAQTLFSRDDAQIGGRFLDVAADPTGGATIIYGRRTQNGDVLTNTLYLQKLAAGADAWGYPTALISGNRGSYPKLSVGSDGTAYVIYNLGSNSTVHVGAIALAPGETRASAEVTVTAGEEGAQGIPALAVDRNNAVWIVYMHQPTGGQANEVRVLRGAVIPSEPAPETPVATPIASPEAAASPSA